MPCFLHIAFLMRSIFESGFSKRSAAASLAAFALAASAGARFFGWKKIAPPWANAFAASCAVWNPFAGKKNTKNQIRLDSSPTMKYNGASVSGKRSTPLFTARKSENRSVFTRNVTSRSALILSLEDELESIFTE